MNWLAQTLGIAVAVLCILSLQAEKRWKILLLSAVANFLSGINYLIFVGFSSAVLTSVLAVTQTTVNMFKALNGKKANTTEKVIYLILYAFLGIIAFKKPEDILVIAASILFALAVFCKKEQNIRLFMLANTSLIIVYNLLVSSTNIYSQIVSFISICIALIRYRKH